MAQTPDPETKAGRVTLYQVPPELYQAMQVFARRDLGQLIAMAPTINAGDRIGVTTRLKAIAAVTLLPQLKSHR